MNFIPGFYEKIIGQINKALELFFSVFIFNYLFLFFMYNILVEMNSKINKKIR